MTLRLSDSQVVGRVPLYFSMGVVGSHVSRCSAGWGSTLGGVRGIYGTHYGFPGQSVSYTGQHSQMYLWHDTCIPS